MCTAPHTHRMREHGLQCAEDHELKVLVGGERWHIELREPRADARWQFLLTKVGRRVHRPEEAKVGMAHHRVRLAPLRERKRACTQVMGGEA